MLCKISRVLECSRNKHSGAHAKRKKKVYKLTVEVKYDNIIIVPHKHIALMRHFS